MVVNNVLFDDLDRRGGSLGHKRHFCGGTMVDRRIDSYKVVWIVCVRQGRVG